ncbi:MarR family winged helix-turn-helix transcriptional regulator [Jongsikchunia kroppenstedtii]|uniref:MarR family winged helix-turn-helix transcriptional regulator n=1 Tax=Jongsikchunia kroppenstedtii TaxID=1121721 RepID=UPI0006856E26|nr:MarR family transcriptional regulator [Jongsikchunia kroppenstedtii]
MTKSNRKAGTRPPAHDDLVDGLVQNAFTTMTVLNQVCAEHDLSPTLLRVLAILWDRRLKITELAEYLGLDKSSMTGLVSRAEKRGLLQRMRNADDGRAVDVVITEEGAVLAQRARGEIAGALRPVTDRLNATDRQRLQLLLQRMQAVQGDPLAGDGSESR